MYIEHEIISLICTKYTINLLAVYLRYKTILTIEANSLNINNTKLQFKRHFNFFLNVDFFTFFLTFWFTGSPSYFIFYYKHLFHICLCTRVWVSAYFIAYVRQCVPVNAIFNTLTGYTISLQCLDEFNTS